MLTTIRPFDVATYIETLGKTHSAPGVKQQLAAVRTTRSGRPGSRRISPTAARLRIPVHRGQSFRRIADSVPVIADSF